jgi:hypothetical protein
MGKHNSNGRWAEDDESTSLRDAIGHLAGTAATVPLVAGYIALGAALIATRGLRNITTGTWNQLRSLLGHDDSIGRPRA